MTADRVLTIDAPGTVVAGQPLNITVTASTDAGGGEQVGFLQIESSSDGGKTWTALCYLAKVGPKAVQVVRPETSTGNIIEVRARAAFRDGLAGDVDYRGGAIRWDETWKKWSEPPARHVVIQVR
jgi:hypothetical protein